MPRTVKAYGCDYKCGQKVVLSKASMISHESRCFHNPKNKACASCKHFERELDDNGMDEPYNHFWTVQVCHAKEINLDKLQSNCKSHETK